MAAHPGDSGAPILNTSGKVIGVLDATSYSSSANEIFTFAQGVNPYFLDWR
jgi:S1-C subfamily serine protease